MMNRSPVEGGFSFEDFAACAPAVGEELEVPMCASGVRVARARVVSIVASDRPNMVSGIAQYIAMP